MLKRENANLAHFQNHKCPFKGENCKILQEPKSVYQILQGTVLLLTISLLENIFTLNFLCLTSILNTKAKYALFVITATVFFLMSKGCSKTVIKMHQLDLSYFCEVFPFFVNLSDTYKCLMMLNGSQGERCLSLQYKHFGCVIFLTQ